MGCVNVFDDCKATLKRIELFSEKFLKFIPGAVPDYPSHGADHPKEIRSLSDRLIEARQVNLTEKETYSLYSGAGVHDIGNINDTEGNNEKSTKILDKTPFFGSILGKDIITLLKLAAKVHSPTYPLERVPKDCLGVRLQLIYSIFRIIGVCEIYHPKCPGEIYKFIEDDPEVSSTLIDRLKEGIDSISEVLDFNGVHVPYAEVAVADDTDHDYVLLWKDAPCQCM